MLKISTYLAFEAVVLKVRGGLPLGHSIIGGMGSQQVKFMEYFFKWNIHSFLIVLPFSYDLFFLEITVF